MNPNRDFRSRLPLPRSSSVFRSSMTRPADTSGDMTSRFGQLSSTAIKQPTARQLIATSTGYRTTARLDSHPYLSSLRPSLRSITHGFDANPSKEVVTRLDFDSENKTSLLSSNASSNSDLINLSNIPFPSPKRSEVSVKISLQSPKPLTFSPKTLTFSPKTSAFSPKGLALSPKNTSLSSKNSSLIQKSPSIDWDAITKEAEMVKLKTDVSRLESLLEESKTKASQKDVEFDLKIEGLKNEIEREKMKTNEAENQIRLYEKRINDLSTQLDSAREQFAKEYQKYENKINQMNRDIVELRNQLVDSQASKESTEARHKSLAIELEHKVETLKIQLSQTNSEKQVLQSRITKLNSELEQNNNLETELINARADIRLLSDELQSYKDGVKLSSILENELKELKELREKNKELQQTNDILSDVHSKNMILEEKIIGLESQLKTANEKLFKSIELDIESNELRNRLAKWEEAMGCDSPSRVSSHLNQLQTNELQLRSELGQLNTQMNELRTEKNRLETELRSTQQKLEEQNKMMNKMQRKCLLLQKETEMYKNLLSSYEQDITLDSAKLNDNRVAKLEGVVSEYKNILESQESELKQLRSEQKVEEYHKEISRLKDELVRSRELIAKLERMQTNAQESQPTHPYQASDDYRIIHFNENPVSTEYKKYMEELKLCSEENERLKARLELLERGYNPDVTIMLDQEIKTKQELEKLQQKLESSEKRQQSIVDAFKRTSKEFREVCYRLLGFKIDLLKQQKYRLSNIYADSPEDCLMFECDSNNTINLLENEYSKRLKDSEAMAIYLSQHDSYPAFLASLTLDLFKRQTIV